MVVLCEGYYDEPRDSKEQRKDKSVAGMCARGGGVGGAGGLGGGGGRVFTLYCERDKRLFCWECVVVVVL